jgi:ABC-type uncharacterized transport system fused permease/ATPase subunit
MNSADHSAGEEGEEGSAGPSTPTTGILEGLSRIGAVCALCCGRPASGRRWIPPAAVLVSSLAAELVSVYIMTIIAGFYFSISSGDIVAFYRLLAISFVVISVLSTIVAVRKFSVDACALQWREDLVLRLHAGYFAPLLAYDMLRLDPGASSGCRSVDGTGAGTGTGTGTLDNPDQRIQLDCDKFTVAVAQALSTLAPVPGILLYYTWHLWHVFGWMAPVACYAYFGLSTYVCSSFTKALIPIVVSQDAAEGDFRARHSRFRARVEAISFLRGESAERERVERSFARVCSNMWRLVLLRVPLHFWVTWFGYMGSVVNYGVVGFTILVALKHEDLSPAASAALLSSGSYACLYLIGTFTALLDMSQEFSQVCGYAARITELDGYAACGSKSPQWLFYTRGSARRSQQGKSNDSCSKGIPDDPLFRRKWAEPFEQLYRWSCSWMGYLPSVTPAYHRLPVSVSVSAWNEGDSGIGTRLVSGEEEGEGDMARMLELRPFPAGGGGGDRDRDVNSSIRCVCSIRHLSISAPRGSRPVSMSAAGAGRVSPWLLADLVMDINRGDRIIITGASGQGKTSLFRVLAGLAAPTPAPALHKPTHGSTHGGHGPLHKADVSPVPSPAAATSTATACRVEFSCAEGDVLFLPQDSFFAEGTLSDNICYPARANTANTQPRSSYGYGNGHGYAPGGEGGVSPLESIGRAIGIGAAAGGTGAADVWSDASSEGQGQEKEREQEQEQEQAALGFSLSPGELQRICIGRALFSKPQIVFMDESTSSLDEEAEESLMRALLASCGTIVTIGHRTSLLKYHTTRLHIHGDGSYTLTDLTAGADASAVDPPLPPTS